MSVHAGIQAAYSTDSHGYRPYNALTSANQEAGPLPPSASSQARAADGRERSPRLPDRDVRVPRSGDWGGAALLPGTHRPPQVFWVERSGSVLAERTDQHPDLQSEALGEPDQPGLRVLVDRDQGRPAKSGARAPRARLRTTRVPSHIRPVTSRQPRAGRCGAD